MVLVNCAYEMDFCAFSSINIPDKGVKSLTNLFISVALETPQPSWKHGTAIVQGIKF